MHIFRLGGIYGPGRSALDSAAKEEAGAAQARRGQQRYTNRCHVYDICQVLLASMQQPRPGAVYNVVDDDPAGRAEVMAYAQELLSGKAAPQWQASIQPSSERRKRAAYARSQAQDRGEEGGECPDQAGARRDAAVPNLPTGLACHQGRRQQALLCLIVDGTVGTASSMPSIACPECRISRKI